MKVSFCIITALLSVTAFSQERVRTDSIYFFRQDSNTYYRAVQSGTFLRNYAVKNAGSLSLSGFKASGHYRLAQMPETSTTVQLKADGIRELGKFSLAGSFRYGQSKRDSIAYASRANDPEAHPFYFATIKAGNYSSQTYHAKGLVSYALSKDNFFIASGFDYSYVQTHRSVDPRLSATQFKFILSPEISYRLKNHYLGLAFIRGYGDEALGVRFKNRVYENSSLYPERYSYINYGYGNIERTNSSLRFIRRQNYTGGALRYSGDFYKWKVMSAFSYLLTNEENREPLDNSITDRVLSDFQMEDISFNLLANRETSRHHSQLQFDLKSSSGSDYLVRLSGKNYTYLGTNITLNWSEAFKRKNKTFELELHSQYRAERRRDAFVDHNSEYTIIRTGFSASYYQLEENYRFSVSFGPQFRKALDHKLYVPVTQETWFSRAVVFPDLYYFAGDALTLNYGLNYTFLKLFSKMKAGISLNGSYSFETRQAIKLRETDFNPDGHRLMTNLNLNLYF